MVRTRLWWVSPFTLCPLLPFLGVWGRERERERERERDPKGKHVLYFVIV
jgi:hypothetical protein